MAGLETDAADRGSFMPPVLEARDVSLAFKKTAGDLAVLQHVSLSVREREIVSLVGPSGCGKSTFLRVLAGLITPDEGSIFINSVEVVGPTQDVAIIFQQNTLFPWLTVLGNVAFGLRSRFDDWDVIREHALQWLTTVQLQERSQDRPSELSGGMAQRVALARALAYSPRILLLDEPFGSLDALSRQEMHEVLLDLWARAGMSMVLVTHDIDEAVNNRRSRPGSDAAAHAHQLRGTHRFAETASIGRHQV